MNWRFEISLLTDRYVLRDTSKWLMWTVFLFGAFMLLMLGLAEGAEGVGLALMITGGAAVFLALITVFSLGVVLGNRYVLDFTVDEAGLTMVNAYRRARFIHRLAIVLGALSGKRSVAASGAAAVAGETVHIPWNDITRVEFHMGDRVIYVKGGWMSRIRFYCSEDNYSAVSEFIRRKMPPGTSSS